MMNRLLKYGLIFLLAFTCAQAQQDDSFGEPDIERISEEEREAFFEEIKPLQIRVQTELIEIPASLLTELRMNKELATNDEKLRDKLEEFLDTNNPKKAKMLESALLIVRLGEMARVESIEELIYATEYEPAEIITPKEGAATKENTEIIPPNPTAFETRNTGLTVEVTAQLEDDGKTIKMNFTSELVSHTGYVSYSDWDDRGIKNAIKMPHFFTIKVNSNVLVKNGSHSLVAVHSPKDDKGKLDRTRKVLCFVKAEILVVE